MYPTLFKVCWPRRQPLGCGGMAVKVTLVARRIARGPEPDMACVVTVDWESCFFERHGLLRSLRSHSERLSSRLATHHINERRMRAFSQQANCRLINGRGGGICGLGA